ncbi:MAG: hypothetical protein WHS87_06360 [Anaerolineales bacterium]
MSNACATFADLSIMPNNFINGYFIIAQGDGFLLYDLRQPLP